MCKRVVPIHRKPGVPGVCTRLARSLAILGWLSAPWLPAHPQPSARRPDYDIVLRNGRVMDPESRFDGVRNVGISGRRIAIITSRPIEGRVAFDAKGMVVAPGFIDLHAHGQDLENNRAQVQDGVTTALELEMGPADVDGWYADRQGKRLINTGVTIGYSAIRRAVIRDSGATFQSDRATYGPATGDELKVMLRMLELGLQRGALGVGWHLNTTPGASQRELLEVFRLAKEYGAVVVPDIRYIGPVPPTSVLLALLEVIGAAASTGAALHVCHICSNAMGQVGMALEIIAGARAQGIDVTTECHPYTVAMGDIQDAYLDEGFQKALGVDYGGLQWVATGERLTKESFSRYRRIGGPVLIHMIPEEAVRLGVSTPLVAVVSDGSLKGGKGHPRSAGTFARVLGRYVREEKLIPLMEALRKMTLMPAQRLESRVPMLRRKGRMQVGADADITVFDPNRVRDRATYEAANLPSEGIAFVMVNVPVGDG